jgi:transcriptional regulator with XRE-family HTH domain
MNQKSKEIIKKISQLRRSNDIRPEQMATVLEISTEQYKKMERGTGEITMSQVFRIAEIFKVQAGSLFDESESVAHINIPQGITEINFTITVKSQDPVDIQSEIAKKYGLSKPTPKEEIIKRSGMARRRW